MIASMTGFGRGEASSRGVHASVELRSVNSRFLEVSTRLPRTLSLRENELKEIIRKGISRGKINMVATIDRDNGGDIELKVNQQTARSYYKLLNDLRKSVKIKETVKLEHLLKFSEIFDSTEAEESDEREWACLKEALDGALKGLSVMRANEGSELKKDFEIRIAHITKNLESIEDISKNQIPEERVRLRERISQLVNGDPVDENRLEMELAILADRLDVTEECVRFRSHNKFFLEALKGEEAAGRKLTFLVQEMNREANTIGSKTNSTEIAHLVVGIKEEIEKIREQLQNIE